MAKRIIWTSLANNERVDILLYWIERNKSKSYSNLLNNAFRHSLKAVAKYPTIGTLSEIKGIRFVIVRDYLIFYQETVNEIFVVAVWDGRRDPEKLKKRLQ